jgi:hypothetical protein
MVRTAHSGTFVKHFGRGQCLALTVAFVLGCADSRERSAAPTTGSDANTTAAGHDAGPPPSNNATPQLDAAAECPWSASARSLFVVTDRDVNNNTWLWGVSYAGPANVGGLIGGRRIITFDDPTMMGRQLEIESTSSVVRELQMGQSLWVVLQGWDGPYHPSLSYQVFRESESGAVLFASYYVDPETQPSTAPRDPSLLGFTVSIADGCSAPVSPGMMACFEDEVRTQLRVSAHADEDVDLEPDRIERLDVGGDAYDFLLMSAERHSGGQSHCPDAVPGTFLAFQMIAAEP